MIRKLTQEEYSHIKEHVKFTHNILEKVCTSDNFKDVVKIASSHHEKFDGTGYFKGLCGEKIPLGGRILAVCDVFDAITSKRHYRSKMEIKNALEGKPDTVERYSETFKCDMTYYATKTALSDGTEVILRLAVRSSQVTPYFTAIIPLFILVLAVSLVLSFVLSTFISRNVSSKVTEIGESLKSLNEGQYAPIQTDMSEPEL